MEYVSDNLKNDKEFVLEAVKSNGYALEYASDNLKNDKDFVLEVVKQDVRALEYVPDNLKNDKEFVLEAVKSNGNALKYASDNLRNDKEFVLDAAKYHSVALQGASDNLKTDKEFLLKALQLDYNKVSFIVMPRYEDGFPYGKVGEWYKEVGDTVKSGEPLFSIHSDKSFIEFESSQNGVLYIVQEEGSEVPVDTIIALLKIEDLDENQ